MSIRLTSTTQPLAGPNNVRMRPASSGEWQSNSKFGTRYWGLKQSRMTAREAKEADIADAIHYLELAKAGIPLPKPASMSVEKFIHATFFPEKVDQHPKAYCPTSLEQGDPSPGFKPHFHITPTFLPPLSTWSCATVVFAGPEYEDLLSGWREWRWSTNCSIQRERRENPRPKKHREQTVVVGTCIMRSNMPRPLKMAMDLARLKIECPDGETRRERLHPTFARNTIVEIRTQLYQRPLIVAGYVINTGVKNEEDNGYRAKHVFFPFKDDTPDWIPREPMVLHYEVPAERP